MAAVACAKNINLRNIGLATKKLNFVFLSSTLRSDCNCGTFRIYNIRYNSNLCNRNNSKSRLLQNCHWFNRKSTQIVNYYVKKKEKTGGPSTTVWAAIGGITCGLLISAIAFLGKFIF